MEIVVILDYGMSNLRSMAKALAWMPSMAPQSSILNPMIPMMASRVFSRTQPVELVKASAWRDDLNDFGH
jgi:hypothetical protein